MIDERIDTIEKLYKENADRVFRYFYYQTSDRALAEDLTSKTFFKVIDKFESFNSRKASAVTWIMTIAKNLLIDYFRLSSTRKSVSLQALEESYSEIDDKGNGVDFFQNKKMGNEFISNDGNKNHEKSVQLYRNKEILKGNIQKLNDEEQLLIFLRFSEEMSYEEIAVELKITSGSVGAKIFRAIKKLKKILEDSGDINKLDKLK